MDEFGGFGATHDVEVDLLTDAFRIAGTVKTRFARATDILNQTAGTHLTVFQAAVSEHADPTANVSAPSALVAISSILVLVAPETTGGAAEGMQIQKRPVQVQLAIPPFRVTGTMHIPPGSMPVDGLLNMSDRFLTLTDATIASARHPELGRSAAAAAVCRERAHVLLVGEDEHTDEALADVLDERTAQAWLHADEESG